MVCLNNHSETLDFLISDQMHPQFLVISNPINVSIVRSVFRLFISDVFDIPDFIATSKQITNHGYSIIKIILINPFFSITFDGSVSSLKLKLLSVFFMNIAISFSK